MLEEALVKRLPGAELRAQRLPIVPEIELFLLADTMSARELPHELAASLMQDPLYWVFCWASGQVLARYLLDRPETVAGKAVLDFGSGSGVVAIAAAMAGARRVIACDIDPLAQVAIARNAESNGVALEIVDSIASVTTELDLILVADVLYDRENLPLLDHFLERASCVLVADSRIRDFDYPPYEKITERESRTQPDLDESSEFNRVSLYSAVGDYRKSFGC
ncbi:MAG: 50S ribosomal protein L11 methyltransferase [Pseudomonadota bacterium]